MRCSIGIARDHRAGIFDDMAARAGDADLGDDPQRHVLGGDMRRQLAVEPDAHALRPLHRHHLRGEDVRKLGGAAAERERAEAADRAGVAVGHRMRRARQHHAELRRDHVRNALLGIAEVEHPDVVLGAALAHRAEEGRARTDWCCRRGRAWWRRCDPASRTSDRAAAPAGAASPAISNACGACSSCSTWRSI